jgi:hypothetical protein
LGTTKDYFPLDEIILSLTINCRKVRFLEEDGETIFSFNVFVSVLSQE